MAVLATKIQANNHVFLINHTYIVLASMRFMSLLSIIKCPVKQLGSLYHVLFWNFLEDSVSYSRYLFIAVISKRSWRKQAKNECFRMKNNSYLQTPLQPRHVFLGGLRAWVFLWIIFAKSIHYFLKNWGLSWGIVYQDT